jgi:hypothetical protein
LGNRESVAAFGVLDHRVEVIFARPTVAEKIVNVAGRPAIHLAAFQRDIQLRICKSHNRTRSIPQSPSLSRTGFVELFLSGCKTFCDGLLTEPVSSA